MTFYISSARIKIEYSLFILISAALILGYDEILLVLLFSSLHELGHIVSLLLLGGNIDEITLSYYGIGMKHSSKLSAFREIIFLSSGIAVNLFFYLISVHREINFALMFINALPLYPLDGGRIFKSALSVFLPLKATEVILIILSVIINALLIVIAIVSKNISLLLISMYIVFYSINITRYV